MPLEWIITIIGLIVITYFVAKPKKNPYTEEDNLTNEIEVKGLPPQFPPDNGGYIS